MSLIPSPHLTSPVQFRGKVENYNAIPKSHREVLQPIVDREQLTDRDWFTITPTLDDTLDIIGDLHSIYKQKGVLFIPGDTEKGRQLIRFSEYTLSELRSIKNITQEDVLGENDKIVGKLFWYSA